MPAPTPTVRLLAAAAGTTLALTLAGCGGSDDAPEAEPSASTSASASASPSPSPSPTTSLSQTEIQAKIAAGASPKNVSWRIPSTPSSWKRLEGDAGTAQWQIGSTACVVQLAQPAGLGDSKAPTADDVADKTVSDVGQAIPGDEQPKVTASEPRMLPNQVVGLDGILATRFASREVTFGPDEQGYVLGYRDGDFALQMTAICGKGEWDANRAAVEEFVKDLAAVTEF